EKAEKVEVKELKHEKVEIKEGKEAKLEKNEKAEIKDKEHKLEKNEPIEHKNFKQETDVKDLSGEFPWGPPGPGPVIDPMQQRLDGIEQTLNQLVHFITREQRPDLREGALRAEPDVAPARKRTTPPRKSGGGRRTTSPRTTRKSRRS